MRTSTLLLTSVAFGALSAMTAFPASAAVLSVAQVTVGCPDIDQARECPALAEEFLTGRPFGPSSDGEIVSLVLAIAELSQVPRVSMPVCLNAADGLRVLALGVSNSDQQVQIEEIADSLCDDTSTAAIRRGLGNLESLASSGGVGGAGGNGGNANDDNDNDNDNDNDDDGAGEDDDGEVAASGLGSNDAAAGKASATGESHASETARNNTRGNNSN